MALNWVEEIQPLRTVICSDSYSVLSLLKRYSIPKLKILTLITLITPCRSKPVKASFVFRTQFKRIREYFLYAKKKKKKKKTFIQQLVSSVSA